MSNPIINWKFIKKLPMSIKKIELKNARFDLKEAEKRIRALESVEVLSIDPIEVERKKQKRRYQKLLKKVRESH